MKLRIRQSQFLHHWCEVCAFAHNFVLLLLKIELTVGHSQFMLSTISNTISKLSLVCCHILFKSNAALCLPACNERVIYICKCCSMRQGSGTCSNQMSETLTMVGREALGGREGHGEGKVSEESVTATLHIAGVSGTHWLPWQWGQLEFTRHFLQSLQLCRYLRRKEKTATIYY